MSVRIDNQRLEKSVAARRICELALPLTGKPWLPLVAAFMLSGCGTASTAESLASLALEVAGLKKPETVLPDAQKAPRTVPIRLHAGENLNVDAAGRPLALAVRMYKLRQLSAFERTRYDAFLSPVAEAQALGADLLEAKELTLTPGQRIEIAEKVTREAEYIGLVALFHSPAAHHWRVAFKAAEAEKAGIVLGLHACALSTGLGAHPSGFAHHEASLSSVRCK